MLIYQKDGDFATKFTDKSTCKPLIHAASSAVQVLMLPF